MELVAATATGGSVKSGAVADSSVIADTSEELEFVARAAAWGWTVETTALAGSPVRGTEMQIALTRMRGFSLIPATPALK